MGVKLVVFDMDGVLVNIKSSWRYLHERLGSIVYVKDSMMGLDYFRRRVSYYEWVAHDVRAMLKARGRVHRSEIESIFNEVEINPEALTVVPRLKELGIKLAIVSGGIDILAERVGKVLGIERVLANGLAFNDEGYLIEGGYVRVKPLEKGEVIALVANEVGCDLDEVMFVADSEYDIPALDVVGYPVVYRNREVHSLSGREYIYIDSLEEILNII